MNKNPSRSRVLPYPLWRLLSACLLLTAFAPAAHADEAAAAPRQLTTVASLDRAARPANVPLDYVVTPNGYFSPACVQVIHQNETLRTDGSILQKNGAVRSAAKCDRPHFDRAGHSIAATANGPVQAQSASGTVEPTYTGWIESANYNNGSNVGRLRATWRVPSVPGDAQNQTVFFFPAWSNCRPCNRSCNRCWAGTVSATIPGPSRAGTAARRAPPPTPIP